MRIYWSNPDLPGFDGLMWNCQTLWGQCGLVKIYRTNADLFGFVGAMWMYLTLSVLCGLVRTYWTWADLVVGGGDNVDLHDPMWTCADLLD